MSAIREHPAANALCTISTSWRLQKDYYNTTSTPKKRRTNPFRRNPIRSQRLHRIRCPKAYTDSSAFRRVFRRRGAFGEAGPTGTLEPDIFNKIQL